MSKRAKMKGAHLYTAAPYGTLIYCFLERDDIAAAYKELTKEELPDQRDMDGVTISLDHDNGGRIILLGWFVPHGEKKREYPALAHECCHATFKVLHHHGVDIDHRNNEAFCYLMDDLMEFVMGVAK